MTKDLHRHPEIKKLLEASEIRFQEEESLSEISDELNTYSIKAFEKTIPSCGQRYERENQNQN